jgi:DUF1016 N-terminal domain
VFVSTVPARRNGERVGAVATHGVESDFRSGRSMSDLASAGGYVGLMAVERVSRSRKAVTIPADYATVLAEMKEAVRSARLRAHRAVNTELLGLYWTIGRTLVERRQDEGWGTNLIAKLAADLRSEFPDMSGLSPRSLAYMRSFALAWPDEVLQQAAAKLPWVTSWCCWTGSTIPKHVTGTPIVLSRTGGRGRCC